MSTEVIVLIAVVAVLVIAAIVVAALNGRKAARKRRIEQDRRDREHAGELRDHARTDQVGAQRIEAQAALARADADAARLEADRLENRAVDLENDAAEVQGAADDRLAEADRLDPDVREDGTRVEDVDSSTADRPRPAEAAGQQHGTAHHDGAQHRGDLPDDGRTPQVPPR